MAIKIKLFEKHEKSYKKNILFEASPLIDDEAKTYIAFYRDDVAIFGKVEYSIAVDKISLKKIIDSLNNCVRLLPDSEATNITQTEAIARHIQTIEDLRKTTADRSNEIVRLSDILQGYKDELAGCNLKIAENKKAMINLLQQVEVYKHGSKNNTNKQIADLKHIIQTLLEMV